MPTYQVRTIHWTHPSCWLDRWPRSTASAIVSTHATYAEAVAACDAANAAAWADPAFNPFLYGGESLFFQTTLPAGPFRDFLQDCGLDGPRSRSEVTSAGWVRWYKSNRSKFTDSQHAALREATNLVRFAEVVEVPDGATKVYVVQNPHWRHHGTPPVAADAGRSGLLGAYRNEAQAESSTDFGEYHTFEVDWFGAEPHSGQEVPVVYTRAFVFRGTTIEPNWDPDSVPLVPVRAFADRASADAHAAELMRVARRTMNPLVSHPTPPRAVLARSLKFKSPKRYRGWRGRVIWYRWYGTEAAHLTDEQRAKVWTLFDDLPLYGVTDVPLG